MNNIKNPKLETVDCLEARMVELELLEQALNAGRDMSWYVDWRLKDLQQRLQSLNTPNSGELESPQQQEKQL